jgi:DNA-binding IclR family transcriptional regulator
LVVLPESRVQNKEAVLDAFEDDGAKSTSEVARRLDISDASVHRILKTIQRHPYYTHVQHPQPEDEMGDTLSICFD